MLPDNTIPRNRSEFPLELLLGSWKNSDLSPSLQRKIFQFHLSMKMFFYEISLKRKNSFQKEYSN